MKYMRFSIIFFVGVLTVATVVQSYVVLAVGRAWVGEESGHLASSSGNWDGGVLPASGDALVFSAGKVVVWDLAGVVPSSVVSSADFSLQTPLTVSGDLTIDNDTFDLNAQPLNIGGAFTMTGGLFLPGASNVSVSGNWELVGGVVELAASSVTLTGSTAKTIVTNGQHFGGLTINSAGSQISVADELYVDNALTVSDGILNIGNKILTVNGGVKLNGGNITLSGGSLILNGSLGRPLVAQGGTLSASNSLVVYNSISGSITVEPLTYGNLELNGSAMFSLSGDTTVSGSLTVGSNAILAPTGYALNVPTGQMTNSGVVTDGPIRCPVLSMEVKNAEGSNISLLNNLSGNIFVSVEDRNLNRKGTETEIVNALVITTLSGDKEYVRMEETAPASGIFITDGLVVHQGTTDQSNGQIEVGQNDIVFVTYADPQDPGDIKTSQIPVSLSSTVVEGTPQIITGPRAVNFSGQNTGSGTVYSAHIIWTTDKVATSAILVDSPQLTVPITAGSLTGTTAHDVVVTGLKRGTPYSFAVSSVTADGKSVMSQARQFIVIAPGDRIKTSNSSAVYWYLNEKRNVFPDATTYDSWFSDFNGVISVPDEQMSDLPLGKNVPIRGGSYLIKIQSDPKTYAVEPLGKLRWIQDEAQAITLYGSAWSKRVRDVDVAQFVSYTVADPLANGEFPSGYLYQIAGGEWSAVVNRMTHLITETGKTANGLSSRFVSQVIPKIVESLVSASAYSGYSPDIDAVVMDGTTIVTAPVFSN